MEMISSTRVRPAVPIPLSFFIINSFSVKVLQISEDYVNPQKTYTTICLSRGRAAVARQAHNLEVVGSNPAPANYKKKKTLAKKLGYFYYLKVVNYIR